MGKTMMKTTLGQVWIQLDGPGTECLPIDCVDSDDLSEPGSVPNLLRCFDENGDWKTIGETRDPPDAVTFGLTATLFEDRHLLERIDPDFPFGLYFLQREYGQAGVFSNYVRGKVLHNVRRTSRTYAGLTARETEAESTLATPFSAWYPMYDVWKLSVTRITTATTLASNDVVSNTNKQAPTGSGPRIQLGEFAVIPQDSAAGPATADVLFSTNFGSTFAAGAADPFAADMDALAVVRCVVGRDTVRYIVGMEPPAGGQGMIAYSDDLGATWTTVNIGGAAAGHGTPHGKALFCLNQSYQYVWLASAAGYIYFSNDGGVSWTAQESAAIGVGDYGCIHFADELHGVAGAPADVIAITNDGGDTWAAATATGNGGDIDAVWRFDRNRILVGTDDGELFMSYDAGVTWTEITGFEDTGTGAITSIHFLNEYQGIMTHNTAGPVGSVYVTFNGGYNWEKLTTPTNTGLNSCWFASDVLGYAVGEVTGGTSVILKIAAD